MSWSDLSIIFPRTFMFFGMRRGTLIFLKDNYKGIAELLDNEDENYALGTIFGYPCVSGKDWGIMPSFFRIHMYAIGLDSGRKIHLYTSICDSDRFTTDINNTVVNTATIASDLLKK